MMILEMNISVQMGAHIWVTTRGSTSIPLAIQKCYIGHGNFPISGTGNQVNLVCLLGGHQLTSGIYVYLCHHQPMERGASPHCVRDPLLSSVLFGRTHPSSTLLEDENNGRLARARGRSYVWGYNYNILHYLF